MKITFTHLTGSREGRTETLEAEVIRIGRAADADLRFDPERDLVVSSAHAEIRAVDGAAILQDVGSLNGTMLNGAPVRETPLRSGDVVELGPGGPRVRVDVEIVPAAAPTAPGPPPGRATVMHMIRGALDESRARGGGMTTFMQEMLGQARQRSARQTMLMGALVLLLIMPLVAWLVLRVDTLERDMAKIQTELVVGIEEVRATLTRELAAAESPEEREAIRQQLKLAEEQIAQVRGMAEESLRGFAAMPAHLEGAIFLLALRDPSTHRVQGFCTAFAVREDGVLFTNGHCHDTFARPGEGEPVVIANRRPDRIYPVVEAGSHRHYNPHNPARSVDLAWLRIDTGGEPLKTVALARDAQLVELVGRPVAVYGYPGELNDAAVSALVLPGAVSDVRPQGPRQTLVVYHTAPTSGGTSGSPLLNLRGEVVGVNHAGRTVNIQRLLEQAGLGANAGSVAEIPLAGRGYAIHGRYLAEFLAEIP